MHQSATFLRDLCSVAALLALCCPAASAAASIEVKVGFGGCWKLGHWTPIVVEAEQETGAAAVVQVVALDGDGVPMVVDAAAKGAGNLRVQPVTRIGRVAPIRVRLTDGGRLIEEAVIESSRSPGAPSRALAATDTLVVRVSAGVSEPFGLGGAGAVLAVVDSPRDLPTDWAGYEGVDLLVIESTAAQAWRSGKSLEKQVAALTRWVETGGRLLLSVGDNAESLVGKGAPLAGLAPGRFRRVVTLPAATPLERYADAEQPFNGPLRVAQFADVEGVIEAHGPGRPSDLPLVVRAAHGLGEVRMLTFDLDTPELAAWPAREQLLRRVAGGQEEGSRLTDSAPGGRLLQTSKELAIALRSRLGDRFAGVRVTPFLAIVAGTLLYVLLIGPGDYYLVSHVLRRTGLTWITFPLFATGAVAVVMLLGAPARTGALRVKPIEVVDIDTKSGAARGRLWAEVYSPRGQRLPVGVQTGGPLAGAGSGTPIDARLGWFGTPGGGLSGMQSAVTPAAVAAYQQEGGRLRGLPINPASTKSLAAAWAARLPGDPQDKTIRAALTTDRNGLVEGTLVNRTGTTLRNARLAFGEWAWRLGTIADGRTVLLDEGRDPFKLTTVLRTDLLGPSALTIAADRRRAIDADTLDTPGLLRLMLFHRQVGGPDYSGRELRYERSVDLSHLLTAGRAVLLAEADGPCSRLINTDTGEPLAAAPHEGTTLCRFILPVGP